MAIGAITQIGSTYSNTNAACASSDSTFTKLTFGTCANNGNLDYTLAHNDLNEPNINYN